MNSRQRRKLAAKQHNDLLIEQEAYREDRVRDPDKYRPTISSRNKAINIILTSLMTTSSMVRGIKYRIDTH